MTMLEQSVCSPGAIRSIVLLSLLARAYDPADYAHLNVSAEIKDLFQYIGRYKAHEVDLDTSLRCFVPDFIPAVGDMDAFLKVPRPDNTPDRLGFKVSGEGITGFVLSSPPVGQLEDDRPFNTVSGPDVDYQDCSWPGRKDTSYNG